MRRTAEQWIVDLADRLDTATGLVCCALLVGDVEGDATRDLESIRSRLFALRAATLSAPAGQDWLVAMSGQLSQVGAAALFLATEHRCRNDECNEDLDTVAEELFTLSGEAAQLIALRGAA